ncbi:MULTISPECIES: hypothetical protein [Micromonospora]|uniref:PAP2 superfamily protein n=1 Tax=Micromonospora yangpuensis TaxID=683228 RepID=A0A1C6UJX7_9ACTN|nr:hypothetical protein [Micromonospora yangpuensis]GGM30932.1 hypothetical protein GCM10012279_57300 [Micromonospora yangpuensis]SCL54254.1 hypothetical protein GA0070617_2610 [Micromonospora yangpuensis]
MIGLVAVARIHVGAHLPIDVVGGVLVGWLAVCLTRLVVGDVGPQRSVPALRAALRRRGIEVARLAPIHGDAANVLVGRHHAHLVDLGFGTDDASVAQRARDVVELLVALSTRVEPASVVAEATDRLGAASVADSVQQGNST